MATGAWHDYYQHYLNLSDSERRRVAGKNADKVFDYINRTLSQEDTLAFVMGVIGVFVSADGTVNESEYDFFCDFTGFNGMSYDEFYEWTKNGYSSAQVRRLDNLVNDFPHDIKEAIVILGTCICACNGTITVAEQEVIEKIWS